MSSLASHVLGYVGACSMSSLASHVLGYVGACSMSSLAMHHMCWDMWGLAA